MHTEKMGGLKTVDKIGVVGLITGIGLASVTTIWAIYLESFIHNASYVGFLTAFFSIVAIITYVFGIPFIEKTNKIKAYSYLVLLLVLWYVLFAIFPNIYIIIILATFSAIFGALRISLYGVIVRDISKGKNVAKNEGLVYTLLNISWLISPVIAGLLASKYGFQSVFFFAAAILLFAFILFSFYKIKDPPKKRNIDHNPLKIFLEFFKDKNRVLAYVLGGGIDFWWVLIYIFIPIHIFNQGLPDSTLGWFLAAVIIPLIIVEYRAGKMASKRGFKNLFFYGYLILGISALLSFVFFSNIYLVLLILSLASFGAGMLEPTTEAYFFDVIKKNEWEKFYGPYNTTINVSSFVARVLSSIILLFLPLQYVLTFFATVMFSIAFLTKKTKSIIED